MRLGVIAAVAALSFAAACSGAGDAAKQAVAAQCIESGQSEQMCNCMAENLAKELSPQQMAILAKDEAAATDAEKAQIQNPEVMGKMIGASMQCGTAAMMGQQ
ncbi:MAG: hypothetical protein HXY28_01190 [Hydrogenophilaceae bacterium]|jgi:hypothetical protein|nr:hypothetical protein [Hydrogenophilaceae bacterium]